MKKLLIIFAVLVLPLGGAGAAAYLGLIPLNVGADDRAAAGQAPTERIEMAPFVLPVIRGGAFKGEVTLAIAIEVRSGPDKFRVWRLQPVLRDAYIKDLYALMSLKRHDTGFFESAYMRRRLRDIADKVVGPGLVRSVMVFRLRTVT